jgi:hypothetical protein
MLRISNLWLSVRRKRSSRILLLLPGRYFVYTAGIGICVGLFYLYSMGHTEWFYNPLLYKLWNFSDLSGPNQQGIVMYRVHPGVGCRLHHRCASGECATHTPDADLYFSSEVNIEVMKGCLSELELKDD